MTRSKRTSLRLFLLGLVTVSPLVAQSGKGAADPPGEWHNYNRDLPSSRYSPLSQIDRTNVSKLALAFQWRPDSGVAPREFKNESTPLMVHGTLYFSTALNRDVVAADAATGRQKWRWHQDEGARAEVAPRRGSGRGVSYWTDGKEERIFVVTPGYRLVALDAKTGTMIESFGSHGAVDLKLQIGVPLDPDKAVIGSSSPPLVFEDFVVIGPALEVGSRPVSYKNVPGRILAIDARSGKLRWRFNTIPQAGEFGVDTWENDSWTYTGNTGAWAPLTLDPARGWLYLPVEAATGDYYGGHRLGNNLFSTTLLCVDIRTGRRVWHYQTVHHDIWDYDNTTAPILTDITVDGRKIQAVVQLTKQSFAYVFDRVTGKPVWPMIEKPVPTSDIPGERTSPTQPFPTKPPAYDRQGVAVEDLIDFTPELRAQALEIDQAVSHRPAVHAGDAAARGGRHQGAPLAPGLARRRGLGRRRGRSRNGRGVRWLAHRTEHPGDGARFRALRHERDQPRRRPAYRAGTPAAQAAVQPHHGDRPEPRRVPLADAERRHAGSRRRTIRRSRASRIPPTGSFARPVVLVDEDAAVRRGGMGRRAGPARARQEDRARCSGA